MRMVAQRQRKRCSLVRKPHFFKVLLADFAQRLDPLGALADLSSVSTTIKRIPPNFMKHIPKEAPRRIFLHGPGGSNWRVRLRETRKGTFLSCGWPKFVKDHSLREHEFLVFRYDGDMHFSVQIFDKTACEREDAFKIRTRNAFKPCEGRNKRGRPVKRFSDISCLLQQQESKIELPKLLTDDTHASNQLQDHCFNSIQESSMLSPKSIGDMKVKSENNALAICIFGSQNKSRGGYLSRRRLVTVEEREQARKAANSFSSTCPYVILCMTETNVYRRYVLRLPVRFSRRHLPRKRTNLVLRDPSGKAWVVFYIPDTRDRLSAGWFSFARGNNLEEGDFCVFELIGPLEMHVHVFRVVEESIPAIRMPKM